MTGPDIGPAPTPRRRRERGRVVAIALTVGGLAVVLAANAHLVYRAVTSQPACVPHIKDVGSKPPGTVYRPAESSC